MGDWHVTIRREREREREKGGRVGNIVDQLKLLTLCIFFVFFICTFGTCLGGPYGPPYAAHHLCNDRRGI